MIKIEETTLLHDTRASGEAGMVIGQHRFTDNEFWPAVFEGLPDEDVEQHLKDMVPQRELERAAADQRKQETTMLASAVGKASTYVKALNDQVLADDAGMTTEEIVALKSTDNATVASSRASEALS